MLYLSIIDNLNCLIQTCTEYIKDLLDDSNIKIIESNECRLILGFTNEDYEVNRELAAQLVFELIIHELNRFTCVISEKIPSDLPDVYSEY